MKHVESVDHYELKEIGDLQPHPENPREISDAARAGLRYSMESFGDLSGIVWNERNGKLVAGHQRVRELVEAGARFSNGALTLDDSGLEFDIRVVDWPEDKHVEAMVVANSETIAGRWTFRARDHLASIRERNAQLFERLRLSSLSGSLSPPPPGDWGDALGGIPDRERAGVEQMTFTLSTEQAMTVREALTRAKAGGDLGDGTNTNTNGNALAKVAEAYNGSG